MQDLCFTLRESLAAATSGKVKLGSLPEGCIYRLKRVEVHIESTAAGNVEVALLAGDTKIAPDTGTFNSELRQIVSTAKKDLPEGATLHVWRKNASATDAYVYFILVDLEQIG